MSTQTCGWDCWYAKQVKCSCSCDGKNHGIYTRDANAVQPQRMKQKQGEWYVLVGTGKWSDVNEIEHEFKAAHPVDYNDRQSRKLRSEIHIAAPTKSQQKWPEFTNTGAKYSYGLWVPQALV